MVVIDIHGHFTAPPELYAYFHRLMNVRPQFQGAVRLQVSDESMVAALQPHLAALQKVGTDFQLISPRPWAFPTVGQDERTVRTMATAANDIVARAVGLFPETFRAVAALPQCAGISPANCIEELERCVKDLGFVGCKINPDAGEGDGESPPMGDEWWYPLYEKMVELDVPGMIHTGGRRNTLEPETGYFPNMETVAANAIMESSVLKDFPNLKLIVAHGGGYLPYQLGRHRVARFAAMQRGRSVESYDESLRHLYYDTVLMNGESLEMLFKVVGTERCLFGTDKPSGNSVIDPSTGRLFDDIKPLIEEIPWLSEADRSDIFSRNAFRVFTRLYPELRNTL